MDFLFWIIFAIPSIILASTVHEYAHGWVAYKLGDYTAKAEGRLSLNPLVHIDPIGALMMVVARFGWSKPVPINEYNFKNPALGTTLCAIAGPLSNLVFALVLSGIFHLVGGFSVILDTFLYVFIMVNISLMIFNLLPLPPLDGHKIVRGLLPEPLRSYWESMERYSILILIFLLLPISPINQATGSFITTILAFFMKILVPGSSLV
jgi:Zn-dependent protease